MGVTFSRAYVKVLNLYHSNQNNLTLYWILEALSSILLMSCQLTARKTLLTTKPLVIDSSSIRIIEEKFRFEYVDTPGLFLGGLKPRFPLAEVCSFDFRENCFRTSQGMLFLCCFLVANVRDTLELIDSKEKFKRIFAPIDDEEESISYVAYLTRTHPEYDIEKNPRYRVYSSYFPSTYSKRIVGGYEVLLHEKKVFGCGPHPNFYKVFYVTDAGEIRLRQTVKMFEDPEEDGLCVD